MMTEEFPNVTISNRNYIKDRNRISCAGASSSLDMMLMMIKDELGDELVSSIEEVLSCDKKRETLDISTENIDYDPTLPQALKTSLELMGRNIEEPLSIEEIASYSNISRRQLERIFTTHIKTSPSRYYLELRLTHARQLLQLTNKSITDIAIATGFNNIAHFRRCFHQLFNISASHFRKNYRGDFIN
ncbi:GlxA family transcriptional regulator [Billgrantia aerodenitrificans]|uniref:GlxA family transcriptional regulator n=1 Tax=Billgrantia aerodenitrificans TaxID=2733483 RepID=UPI001F38331B|nr:helix-turn-helix domain-containing protein [Halomonas aerodenitrificans]